MPLPPQQQQHSLLQKHHMMSSPSLSKPRRPSLPFSQTTISLPDHDGSTTPLLKRSNTMPLKRANNKNTDQGKERYIHWGGHVLIVLYNRFASADEEVSRTMEVDSKGT